MRGSPLPLSFFRRPATEVARDLLGAVVVSETGGVRTTGRIVETEAYLGTDDPASHGYRNRRHAQNQNLFGPPGAWYVYRSYGVHWCANLVCHAKDSANAVLLRALEPVDGFPVMRERRGDVADRLLCSGPGRLCEALGITRLLDGAPMRSSLVQVYRAAPAPEAVDVGPRVGITKAAEWPLRFMEAGSRWISRGPVRL